MNLRFCYYQLTLSFYFLNLPIIDTNLIKNMSNFFGKSSRPEDTLENVVLNDAFPSQITDDYSVSYTISSTTAQSRASTKAPNDDRYGRSNSAIYFQNGFLQVPPGIYFSGDFTIIVWIQLRSFVHYSRIIDFSNGGSNDLVTIFYPGQAKQIYAGIWHPMNKESHVITNSFLELNNWYHVAFVSSNKKGYIYVNGGLMANGSLLTPNNVTRKENYIGKSNSNDPNANAVYDELKIYAGSLSAKYLLEDYINSSRNVLSLENCMNSNLYKCINRGRCTFSMAKYICRCSKGYSGRRCEKYNNSNSYLNHENDWVYYTSGAFCLVILITIAVLLVRKLKKSSNRLNAAYSAERDEIRFNRPAVFTTATSGCNRHTRDTDSLCSYEDALRNSVLVVQENANTNNTVNKLPSYEEYVKQHSSSL